MLSEVPARRPRTPFSNAGMLARCYQENRARKHYSWVSHHDHPPSKTRRRAEVVQRKNTQARGPQPLRDANANVTSITSIINQSIQLSHVSNGLVNLVTINIHDYSSPSLALRYTISRCAKVKDLDNHQSRILSSSRRRDPPLCKSNYCAEQPQQTSAHRT